MNRWAIRRMMLSDLRSQYRHRSYQAAYFFERHIGALVLRRSYERIERL